jgi:hypothetical protein
MLVRASKHVLEDQKRSRIWVLVRSSIRTAVNRPLSPSCAFYSSSSSLSLFASGIGRDQGSMQRIPLHLRHRRAPVQQPRAREKRRMPMMGNISGSTKVHRCTLLAAFVHYLSPEHTSCNTIIAGRVCGARDVTEN